MRLNPKNKHGDHITNINGKRDIVKEERPAAFSDTTDSDVESGDVADVIIRQNQIINRALRRTFRSRIARKAI
jgi:hypothetical protein